MHWTYTPHWPWWPLIFSTKIFYRGSPVFFYLDLGVTAMLHTPKPNSTVGADGPLPPNRNKKLDPRLNSRYWAAMSKADSAAVHANNIWGSYDTTQQRGNLCSLHIKLLEWVDGSIMHIWNAYRPSVASTDIHALATLVTKMLQNSLRLSYNTCAMLLRGYCLICLLRRMELVTKVPGKLPAKVLGAFDLQRQYTQLICDTATI